MEKNVQNGVYIRPRPPGGDMPPPHRSFRMFHWETGAERREKIRTDKEGGGMEVKGR